MTRRRAGRALLAAAVLAGSWSGTAQAAAPVLHVDGRHFVNARGEPVRLFPAHVGTGEYTCVQPVYDPSWRAGTFSVRTDTAVMAAARRWGFNAIRISLNEQCWLGVNPVVRGSPTYGIRPLTGSAALSEGAKLRARYRAAVQGVVARAHRAGLAVIFDLHWSAAGDAIAWAQWPLPDRQYSVPFWRSIAATFRADAAVMFELFNEPVLLPASPPLDEIVALAGRDWLNKPVRVPEATLPWRCLRDGCLIPNACADCDPHPNDGQTGAAESAAPLATPRAGPTGRRGRRSSSTRSAASARASRSSFPAASGTTI